MPNSRISRQIYFQMFFIFLLAAFVALIVYWKFRSNNRISRLPPGPPPLPVIGNLHQLDLRDADKQFLQWTEKYGDVFTIYMPEPYVIINDYATMKETFVKQGELFAGRPSLNFWKIVAGGMFGLFFADNAWYKPQRRFTLHVLRDFGIGRPILQDAIIEQARTLVQLLRGTKGQPIELKTYFLCAVSNIINQLVFGYMFEFGDPALDRLKRLTEQMLEAFLSPLSLMIELWPAFRHIDKIVETPFGRMTKANDELLTFFRKELEEHKRTVKFDQPPRDYVDAYLTELENRKNENGIDGFTEHQLIFAVYDLFTAGMETTVTGLRWAVLYLLHHPDMQTKLQEELDHVVGREVEVTAAHQSRLPYTQAFIQEFWRLGLIFPLQAQHMTLDDTTIAGYAIPKGTIVIAQVNSVHLNAKNYPDPNEFRPERHLSMTGEFVKDDRIMPFSLGKRACLGESLARTEFFVFFASLLQNFRFEPVDGTTPPAIDFVTGAVRAPVPYKCRVVERESV